MSVCSITHAIKDVATLMAHMNVHATLATLLALMESRVKVTRAVANVRIEIYVDIVVSQIIMSVRVHMAANRDAPIPKDLICADVI